MNKSSRNGWNVEKVAAEPEEHQEEPKDEKEYTDADVDKIINSWVKKNWKRHEKKSWEVAKMNAESRSRYEKLKQAEHCWARHKLNTMDSEKGS